MLQMINISPDRSVYPSRIKVGNRFEGSTKMKRLCKHVDIADISFIKESIRECLKNKNKRRKDIKKLLNKYQTIDDLAYTIQKELKE